MNFNVTKHRPVSKGLLGRLTFMIEMNTDSSVPVSINKYSRMCHYCQHVNVWRVGD